MSKEMPFNEYLEYFGPEFKLEVKENNMDNSNSREYLEKTTYVHFLCESASIHGLIGENFCDYSAEIIDSLRNLPFAPSAQMQPVPYDMEDDSGDSDSDLDVRISGTFLSLLPRHFAPNPSLFLLPQNVFDKPIDPPILPKKTFPPLTNPPYRTLTAD